MATCGIGSKDIERMAGVGVGRRPVLGYRLTARVHVSLYVWTHTQLYCLSRVDRETKTGLFFSTAESPWGSLYRKVMKFAFSLSITLTSL